MKPYTFFLALFASVLLLAAPAAAQEPAPTSETPPITPQPLRPAGGGGGSGSAAGETWTTADTLPGEPVWSSSPYLLRLDLYLDRNGDGWMGTGEALERVRVLATTRNRAWQYEAVTAGESVLLPLTGLQAGEEVVVIVPYLQRSARFTLREENLHSEIRLEMPVLPVYLP